MNGSRMVTQETWVWEEFSGHFSDLCFFFSFGLQRVEFFRVHEFSLSNSIFQREYNVTKEYIGGLLLASIGVFGHFI